MFERMDISEQVYKGGTPSKTPTREESNRDGHVRKWEGGETASSTNRDKGRTRKRKTKHSGRLSGALTGAKKTCILHGPGHSSEACKLIKI